jgi:hypothetical protein
MSIRRVWAFSILLSVLVSIPYAWGSIPARLQAAAAARNPVKIRHGHLSDTTTVSGGKVSSRARASVPVQDPAVSEIPTLDTLTLDMPLLETPGLEAPALESATVETLTLDEPALDEPALNEGEEVPVLKPAEDDMAPALEPIPLDSPEEDSTTPLSAPRAPLHALRDDADSDVEALTPRKLVPESDESPVPKQPTGEPAAAGSSKLPQASTEAGSKATPKSNSPTPPAANATKPAKTFSPEMTRLRNRIRTCLSYYYQHATSIDERSPWGVMHSLIAFGVDTELVAGNKRVNAIGWLCYNRPCKGMTLMTVKDGQLVMRQNGPGYQGHDGQLLSMLALSGVKSNYPIRVEGHEFTVADLVAFEQLHCKPKSELTFQLIGLVHYLPSDATWEDKSGGDWSIPRLIREELAQPVNGAACGGTHRLIGLSMAVKTRQKRGEPMDGEWLRAQKFTTSYQQHAFKLQNRDGSFSTSWLAKRDDSGDIDRRIQTSGHILEWLIFSLPEKDLTDPRMVKGISYLTNVLMDNDRDWEIGPRGHALRALALYNERVFGDKPGERRELLARRPGK